MTTNNISPVAKSTETIQDIVGSLVVGQNDANVTYDDVNDQLSVDVSTLSNEEVEDAVASLVRSDSNLSWSYDDTNDTLTVSLNDSISVNTLEAGNIVDGADVSHSDELADAADVVDDHANLSNVTSSQHHEKGATITEQRFLADQIGGYY